MMKKIRDWLRAAWLSFRVSQNARRLAFLRNFILIGKDETSITACRVIDCYFTKYPQLDANIWPLDTAQKLLQDTAFLIRIVESIAYGTD